MSSKLNELIAVIEGASNRLIDVESLSEEELETIHRHYQRLALMAKREASITLSHSIEEAESRHQRKASANSRSGRAPARRPRRRRRVPVSAVRTLPMPRETP